jgi:hypothetical protein
VGGSGRQPHRARAVREAHRAAVGRVHYGLDAGDGSGGEETQHAVVVEGLAVRQAEGDLARRAGGRPAFRRGSQARRSRGENRADRVVELADARESRGEGYVGQ